MLVSTILPHQGGVAAKVRWAVAELQALGLEPVLGWYEPWSRNPELSVPLHQLASGRTPGHQQTTVCLAEKGDQDHRLEAVEGHAIGAWLPELEFTHYLPGRHWRKLIASCQVHLAITGNPLCAHRYTARRLPFLAWVGTSWQGDRQERVRHFSLPRRVLDLGLNSPVLRQQERRVLQDPRGRILTISHHTARELKAIGGRSMAGVLHLPPDPSLFHPANPKRIPWRIGFSGRYSDPRKRIQLLLKALATLRAQGHPAELHLTGERSGSCIQPLINDLGLRASVICHPFLEPPQLAALMQSLDVFVIPSQQEGLCIAAIEAMACGVPVVSTRCGGPEDFVIEAETGRFVEGDPAAMAAAITSICSDRDLQQRLRGGACGWVRREASQQAAQATFRSHLIELMNATNVAPP